VKAAEVSFAYLDTPFYLQPDPRSAKVYALLRESMKERQVIAVARVVMRSKEHLHCYYRSLMPLCSTQSGGTRICVTLANWHYLKARPE